MSTKRIKVVEKNEGEKVQWEQNGTVIALDDYALTVNCNRYRKDWPVHLDICRDAGGNLSIGTAGSAKYVAEIDIPAATYTYPEPDPDAEPGPMGEIQSDPPILNPIDMSEVVLTLWAI